MTTIRDIAEPLHQRSGASLPPARTSYNAGIDALVDAVESMGYRLVKTAPAPDAEALGRSIRRKMAVNKTDDAYNLGIDALVETIEDNGMLLISRDLVTALANDLNTLDEMLQHGDVGALYRQAHWPAARELVVLADLPECPEGARARRRRKAAEDLAAAKALEPAPQAEVEQLVAEVPDVIASWDGSNDGRVYATRLNADGIPAAQLPEQWSGHVEFDEIGRLILKGWEPFPPGYVGSMIRKFEDPEPFVRSWQGQVIRREVAVTHPNLDALGTRVYNHVATLRARHWYWNFKPRWIL